MRVINMGLLLVCAAFAQSFKSQGGGNLREEEEYMWRDYLMDRDDNHDEIKAVLPGTCFVCKRIIKKVKAQLDGDDDRDNISAKVDAICGRLGMLKVICKKLVNIYKEKLIDALANNEDAKTACKELKLCKRDTIYP